MIKKENKEKIRWFSIPGKDNELARKWNYNQDYEFKWEKGC